MYKRQPIREPSIEVIATGPTDRADIEISAVVSAPTVTYIHTGQEADVTLSGEVTPSGEVTSHTYIVHHDWPRVKLTLPAPKGTLAVSGGGVDAESVSGTLERKTYVVHYDWPTKTTKVVSVIPQREPREEPEPLTIAVCPVPPATEVETHVVRDEHVEPAAVTVVSPSGDVTSHTYIVHHDWPRVKLTLSEPKTRLDSGSHVESDVETDRQLLSRTYVVRYEWPSLNVKATQPPGPSDKVVIEKPEVTVRRETDVDVDATVRQPLPGVVVQYDVPGVEIREPEAVEFPEPTIKVIAEREPEPEPTIEVPLRAEVDFDVDVTVSEPLPPSVAQHEFLPTVQIQEPEPIRIPEPAVQTIEVEPQVDERIWYETDIDLAVAEHVAPPPAVATVPASVTFTDEGKDEHAEPSISIVAPSGEIVTHTYVVHHDWPRIKLTLSEPKRRLDTGLRVETDVEADRQRVSRTYVVHYDWPSLKIQSAGPSARIVSVEPQRTAELTVQGEAGVDVSEPVVFHYDVPAVEIEEPQPIQIREPSIEVIATGPAERTDMEIAAAVAAPTVTYIHAEQEADVTLSGEVTPSGEVTSHTYIVHHDWPRVKLTLPAPKGTLTVSGGGVDAESVSGTLDRKTYVVHYDWPTKTTKVVSVIPQHEPREEPEPPTIAVCPVPPATEVETHLVRGEHVEPAAVTLVSPGDVTSHTYIVHHDWPRVKLTLSEPKTRLDSGLHVESDVETDRQLQSRTYVVHYDWPSLKVMATQPPGASAKIVIEKPEVTVRRETDIDVDVVEPVPSVVVQYEVPEVEIQEPEAVEIPEPTIKVITEREPEPEPTIEVPLRSEVDLDVDVTVSEPLPTSVVQHELLPTVNIQELEPIPIQAPSSKVISLTYVVHWPSVTSPKTEKGFEIQVPATEPTSVQVRVDEEPRPTDICVDAEVVMPEVEVKAAVAAPDMAADEATVADEGKVVVPAAVSVSVATGDAISHTYIVHHDWPKVKLVTPVPKMPLVASATEDSDADMTSRTYIVHYDWPAIRIKKPSKPASAAEAEAVAPKVEEVEVTAAVTTPDVPEAAATVADEEKVVVPAAVSVSVTTGDAISHTYVVHHDWPRVRLVTPEPKMPLDAGVREGFNADTVSRTYIVHYDWPAIQIKRPSISEEPPSGAAIQAIDSGTDVSGEVGVEVTKPTSGKVTHTYIVHYDWPTGKAKVERQPPAEEIEVTVKTQPELETSAVGVSVDQPDITQQSPPEISLETSQPEEPALVETVVVSAPDIGEPSGEATWQVPVTDITIELSTVDNKPHLDTEEEPAICTVSEGITAGADLEIEPSPLIAATAVDLPPITVAETTHVEPADSGETRTYVVDYELVKTPVKVAQREAVSVEVEAPKDEVISKKPQEDICPETITYVVTYDVNKKEAGKPTELELKVERRRSSVEEAPRPELEVLGGEPAAGEGPSPEVLVLTPAAPKKAEEPDEETVKYVVQYQMDVVKGKFPRLFMKKVSEVPAPETPEVVSAPSTEVEGGTAAEGHGIPVQTQISETVNVDYDAVKIAAPAIIVERSVETCLLYTSPSPRDRTRSRMPSSA